MKSIASDVMVVILFVASIYLAFTVNLSGFETIVLTGIMVIAFLLNEIRNDL